MSLEINILFFILLLIPIILLYLSRNSKKNNNNSFSISEKEWKNVITTIDKNTADINNINVKLSLLNTLADINKNEITTLKTNVKKIVKITDYIFIDDNNITFDKVCVFNKKVLFVSELKSKDNIISEKDVRLL